MGDRPRPWPLAVRRARADDRAAVVAFASRTWDGWDYVPRAWPHWLEAADGVLLVATAGGRAGDEPPRDADGDLIAPDQPIAVARVALLSPSEAWLEGIRVDPRARGLGVATDFQVAELHWAAASGARIVRYATGERNEASHRLGARHGFELLAEFRRWQWHERAPSEGDEDDDDISGFDDAARARANGLRASVLDRLAADGSVCAPPDADGCWARLSEDATVARAHGLYEYRGWTMQQLTRSMFDRHVATGEVLVARGGRTDGPWALAILQREALPAEDADIKFAAVAGRAEALADLAQRVRRLAGERVGFWLPHPDAPLLEGRPDVLTEIGFHPRPWSLHILARPLDDAHPPPKPDHPGALILADPPRPMKALVG